MSTQIAALAAKLEAAKSKNKRIQLLPFGRFRSNADSRPTDVPAWILDDSNGELVAAAANALTNDIVIDYEHQTILKEQNGMPAPAAGWIKHVEYVPEQGLFADVEWTPAAAKMILDQEYKYVSAVFSYDVSGKVVKLLHAAVTNFPALDGMAELTAACSHFFLNQQKGSKNMTLIELLRQAFEMPEGSEEQLKAALSALLQEQPATVALSGVFNEIKVKDKQIAALTAQLKKSDELAKPDPATYAPVEIMKELQQQVAALTAQINTNHGDQIIDKAIKDGKLLPAQKAWAENLVATAGVAQLTAYLDTVSPIAALTNTSQSGQNAGKEIKTAALTAEQKEAAKMLGYTEKEYFEMIVKEKD